MKKIEIFLAVSLLFASTLFASVHAKAQTVPGDDARPENVGRETALDAYIARDEPLYRWEAAPPRAAPPQAADPLMSALGQGSELRELRLTSQEWQGRPWRHRVQLFRPARLEFPHTALLYVVGGNGSPSETALGYALANAVGATVVTVFNVPNQPLYGKTEDALIAHTFQQYLETDDATWPLLFPMTKSAVKTMDAVGEYARQQEWPELNEFIVTGASKRGWTTWLTGAVDKRVIGLMPMVYDNLNLPAQMPHQLETWGEYSEQIQDYTRLGLQQQMASERGRQLAEMVDPYAFRERFTMPKFIVNATNDRYWALDAANLYLPALPGPTNLVYFPNAGHSLDEQAPQLVASLGAWFRRVASRQPLPEVELLVSPPGAVPKAALGATRDGERHFVLTSSAELASARLWVAQSPTRDFRAARWEEQPLTRRDDGHWSAVLHSSNAPHEAVFAEAFVRSDSAGKRANSLLLHVTTAISTFDRE